ncbi:hypothetical protein [Streptomyces sp. NPDC000931]
MVRPWRGPDGRRVTVRGGTTGLAHPGRAERAYGRAHTHAHGAA